MSMLVVIMFLAMQVGGLATPAMAPVADDPASTYDLDVALRPPEGTISGTLRLEWVNDTGEPQRELPFRLYPNGDHYTDGSITVSEVEVEGVPVTPVLDDDPTVMTVPLRSVVSPSSSVSLALTFETAVPEDLGGSFGILQHLSERDWWALADWYPVVAGWEGEWYLDPPTSFGDPTFAPTTANYDVTVQHPASLTLIGAGDEVMRAGAGPGITITAFSESRLREFAMVAMPGDELSVSSFDAGGQPVAMTIPGSWNVPGLEAFIETRVRTAIPLYQQWFGISSDEELDLTVAVLSGALGVSWDQILWLDLESIARDGVLDDAEKMGLEPVIYHELGHQWLAADIGTNSNDHTFLTEGLVNTLVVAIVRESDGAVKAKQVMGGFVAGPYRAFVNGFQDGIVDEPISDERNGVVHSFLVYGKAGVGFEAVRQEVGDDAFFRAIADLGATYNGSWFAPEDLLSLFEQASGESLESLWSFWFQQENTALRDVDAVVAASG